MAEATSNKNRLWQTVRGMTNYVSRIYKLEKYGIKTSEITEAEVILPKSLKNVLSYALDPLKDKKFVKALNHYVKMEDRANHVKKSFQTGLLEIAKAARHEAFLKECVLYIISATEMARLGFDDAIYIVMNCIYYASKNSVHHKSLVEWETPAASKGNNQNNDVNSRDVHHKNREQYYIPYPEIDLCTSDSDIEILD